MPPLGNALARSSQTRSKQRAKCHGKTCLVAIALATNASFCGHPGRLLCSCACSALLLFCSALVLLCFACTYCTARTHSAPFARPIARLLAFFPPAKCHAQVNISYRTYPWIMLTTTAAKQQTQTSTALVVAPILVGPDWPAFVHNCMCQLTRGFGRGKPHARTNEKRLALSIGYALQG